MKYQYFYQTKQNEERSGWIKARDRNHAYTLLRRQGIKPYKLLGNNPIPWKRWAAIVVLALALAATLFAWRKDRKEIAEQNSAEAENRFVPRHQIYGDPSIIEKGIVSDWPECGFLPGEVILARFAQPGRAAIINCDEATAVKAIDECLTNTIVMAEGELYEYRQVKEIVESMKAEARSFIAEGDTTAGYINALISRQKQEIAYYNAARQEVLSAKETMDEKELTDFWGEKNAGLRAIGVPAIPFPGEEEL